MSADPLADPPRMPTVAVTAVRGWALVAAERLAEQLDGWYRRPPYDVPAGRWYAAARVAPDDPIGALRRVLAFPVGVEVGFIHGSQGMLPPDAHPAWALTLGAVDRRVVVDARCLVLVEAGERVEDWERR
jgi:hypothetical protein